MNESKRSRPRKINVVMMIGLMLSFLIAKCSRDKMPIGSEVDDPEIMQNDIYEPNNARGQAFKLEPLPYLNLHGVLLDRNDIDWFQLSVIGTDTFEVKVIFDMEGMTDKLALGGCFYGEAESPKGCFHLYKGLDSDATVTFGCQCVPGNYCFNIKIDSTSQKEAGKYSFDLVAIP